MYRVCQEFSGFIGTARFCPHSFSPPRLIAPLKLRREELVPAHKVVLQEIYFVIPRPLRNTDDLQRSHSFPPPLYPHHSTPMRKKLFRGTRLSNAGCEHGVPHHGLRDTDDDSESVLGVQDLDESEEDDEEHFKQCTSDEIDEEGNPPDTPSAGGGEVPGVAMEEEPDITGISLHRQFYKSQS
ncbi:hypothetical protein J6590_026679 [Homalodisca vitripennis]|nr:hypothetical protein J6590_026679 [Homalodisca vitripennis]